eukprot:1796429-Amphidinium_carterae.1
MLGETPQPPRQERQRGKYARRGRRKGRSAKGASMLGEDAATALRGARQALTKIGRERRKPLAGTPRNGSTPWWERQTRTYTRRGRRKPPARTPKGQI